MIRVIKKKLLNRVIIERNIPKNMLSIGPYKLPLNGESIKELTLLDGKEMRRHSLHRINEIEKEIILYSFHDGFQRIVNYCLERRPQKFDERLPGFIYIRDYEKSQTLELNYIGNNEKSEAALSLYWEPTGWKLKFRGKNLNSIPPEELSSYTTRVEKLFFD